MVSIARKKGERIRLEVLPEMKGKELKQLIKEGQHRSGDCCRRQVAGK